MIKSLILFLIINYNLVACTMCAIFVPKVEVHTTIFAKESSTTFDVKWQFHPEFNKALEVYDVNNNKKYERAERDAIKKSIEEYITPLNFLINIEYLTKNEKFTQDFLDTFTINYTRLSFAQNDAMVYEFNIDLPIVLKPNHKLYISHFDDGGNFDFIMKDILLKHYNEFKMIQPEFTHSKIYFYENETITKQNPRVLSVKEIPEDVDVKTEVKAIQEDKSILKYMSEELENIKDLLEQNLQDIKQNNSISSYFWLLLFSLLYGILHALGPGHGKTLVSSYFLGQNRSYMKAFTISSMIGLVHTFSAFILTLIVYYVVGTLLSSFIIDVEKMATKVSAGIIILIALYLLFQKFFQKTKPLTFSAATKPSFVKAPSPQQVHHNNLSCSCSGCKTQSTDIGVILAAGLVPCPGTVTIFIFTMSLGIYFVGFLSAVFMSIGMSFIIFLTALVSVKIRKTASTNHLLVKLLEYGSVFFILLLGMILLII